MDEKPGQGPSDEDLTLGDILPSSLNPNAPDLDANASSDGLLAADPLCPDSRTSSSSTDLPEQTNQLTYIEQKLRAMHRQMKAFSKKHQQLAKKYRRLRARVRALETRAVEPATTSTEVVSLEPKNPVRRPLRTASDFLQLNAGLTDTAFRNQLITYLVFLGGKNTGDLIMRIFKALFDFEIAHHVNFTGKHSKESLSGSKTYEVIKEVFVRWSGDGKCTLSDLEVAVTKRLHNYFDAHAKRIRSAKDKQRPPPPPPSGIRPPPYTDRQT